MGEEIEPGKLFVGGLSWNTTNESLKMYFSKYGEVSDCVVMKDSSQSSPHGQPKPRGFGFVTFADPNSVTLALAPPNEHTLDGKTIDPKPATMKGKGTQKHKLFAGGLAPTTTADTLVAYFNSLPGIKALSAEIKKNAEGKSKGFGFLEVDSEESVARILSGQISYRYNIDGKSVEMKKANPQDKLTAATNNATQHPVYSGQQLMYSQQGYYAPNSYDRTGQFASGSSYPQYNYPDSYTGYSNPQSVYGFGQYSGARGYSGQQMGSYPSNTSYNQTSTNFPSTESSYSSGVMNYGNYHQQSYNNYGDQPGGGASPSYSRAGMNSQNRTSSAGSHGYPSYGTR